MSDFSVEIESLSGIDGSNDIIVVKTVGSINTGATLTLNRHLEDLVAKKHYTLVVDLSESNFISSSGIAVLLTTVNIVREEGGDLILMNPPKLINDILRTMNIKNYFRTITSLDDLTTVQNP